MSLGCALMIPCVAPNFVVYNLSKRIHPPQPLQMLSHNCYRASLVACFACRRVVLFVSYCMVAATLHTTASSHTMTGNTFTNEKEPQTPTSPTNTYTSTLHGDFIIDIREDDESTPRPSSDVYSSAAGNDIHHRRSVRS